MTNALAPLARKGGETKVELAKRASDHLRGHLWETLADPAAPFADADRQVLKFHGVYQQEDRDLRAALRGTGAPRRHNFMVRVKIPGGALTAAQYLAMDRVADAVVYNRSLRVTTRQNLQLHGVLKHDLRPTVRRINEALLSTLCGCGDVERNVVAPPAPLADVGHRSLQALAQEITAALTPATRAYHEVWLDGVRVDSSHEAEPLYGDQYLPRKFKTGLALPDDNSTDVFDQDVGLIALVEDDRVRGFDVVVGGGGGMTHRNPATYARLATPLGCVDAAHAVPTVQLIATMFRDYGDRTDRQHARLKYVVEEYGVEGFRNEFRRRATFPLRPWVALPRLAYRDWLGWHPQGDGRWFYGVHLESGRIADEPRRRSKTALRLLVEGLAPRVILTPQQNLLLADLDADARGRLEQVLRACGLPVSDEVGAVRRNALVCPALPTCGLALAEAERVAPGILEAFATRFHALGVDASRTTVRITGCPNGCARPYNADLGIVGRKPGHYDLFVGGNIDGERLGELYAESVPQHHLVDVLRPLLEAWATERHADESLGDFYERTLRPSGRRDLVDGGRDAPARARVEKTLHHRWLAANVANG